VALIYLLILSLAHHGVDSV